jgi:transposase
MIPSDVAIFLATSPVDLRAGFDRLAGLVLESLKADPRSGSLFLFANKRRTHVKALFFDRTGYCILYKRLDRGTFPMPTVIAPGSSHTEISGGELALLLEGLLPLPRKQRGHEGVAAEGERPRRKRKAPFVH